MAAHNNPTALTEAQLEQRRLKADVIAEPYALVGLDVIALGDQDWILGTDWLRDMVKRHELLPIERHRILHQPVNLQGPLLARHFGVDAHVEHGKIIDLTLARREAFA